MTIDARLLLVAALACAAGCDHSPAATAVDSSSPSGADAQADACTHDNCVVPLAAIAGVCAPTLAAASASCVGVTVSAGACGAVTHVAIDLGGTVQDCYYRTSSGALVGGVVRSDAGFTKIAGTIPTDTCSPTTQVCPVATADAASDAHAEAGADAPSDACTHEDCVVPLAAIADACAPTLQAATTHCPYAAVSTGPCGALTHVVVQTINPYHDCYYDTASGALVGGIARSDAGFTKIAGTLPTDTCPATTKVCDHAS